MANRAFDIVAVADRIRAVLKLRNMSATAASLATTRKGARPNPDVVRNLLRGAKSKKPYNPREGTIEAIAAVLGVTAEWLRYEEGDGPLSAGTARGAVAAISDNAQTDSARILALGEKSLILLGAEAIRTALVFLNIPDRMAGDEPEGLAGVAFRSLAARLTAEDRLHREVLRTQIAAEARKDAPKPGRGSTPR